MVRVMCFGRCGRVPQVAIISRGILQKMSWQHAQQQYLAQSWSSIVVCRPCMRAQKLSQVDKSVQIEWDVD